MKFPLSELETIDATIRAFSEPVLIGDIDEFAAVWRFEIGRAHV